MSLVNAKCTNCGATLIVENTNDAAMCQFCGSAFIIEKAINNFNMNVNVELNIDKPLVAKFSEFIIRAGILEKYTGESTDVIIPDNVHSISSKAFSHSGIKCIQMSNNIKTCEKGAFGGCTLLEKVVLSESLDSISESLFYDCKNLRKIVIPENITEIEARAFESSELVEITIPSSVRVIGGGAFKNCKNLKKVVIEPREDTTHKNCRFDKAVNERSVFEGCPNITDVHIKKEHCFRAEAYFFFSRTPWFEEKQKEWKKAGLCKLCGNPMKGLIHKKCSICFNSYFLLDI